MEKPIKTGRIPLALGKLIGLVGLRPFLIMEKYYKKPISLLKFRGGKITLKLQAVPTLNLPIKSANKDYAIINMNVQLSYFL